MSPFVLQLKGDAEDAINGIEEVTSKFAARRERLRSLNDSLPKGQPQDLDGTNNPIWRYTELQALHPRSVADLRVAELSKQKQEEVRESARLNLEKAMKQDSQLQATSRTLDFSAQVLSEASRILENWKKLVRDQVSQALSTEFAPMLPKERFVKDVWIDDEFKVHVTSETGNDVVEELSSGERQSLAFAFSFGLNKVSGYALPMVIDTPFGRMGEKMKTQVASALARNTLGSEKATSQQVIVLMTDTEFSKEVAAKFDSRSPYLLRIRNDKGTLSTIEEM
jgi:DNA sulfur modification protein DndD